MLAAEAQCARDEDRGFVYPNPMYVHANSWLQATHYTGMLTTLRELAGAGVLQLPSSYRDYQNPEIARDLNRFIQSPGVSSVERTKLFKLVWDLVGTEFAGRHQQYELLYAGSRAVTTSIRAYNSFDFDPGRAQVERCLASYDLPPSTAEGPPGV